MAKDPLGALVRLDPRDYWEKEAAKFTPWLGRTENLKLLGDAIGRDLEPKGQEIGVGPSRADLLCRDVADFPASRDAPWRRRLTLGRANVGG